MHDEAAPTALPPLSAHPLALVALPGGEALLPLLLLTLLLLLLLLQYNQVHTIEQQLQQLERPATGRAGGAAASAGDMMTPSTPAGPASAALITPYGTAVAPAQRPAAGNAGDNADTAPRSSPGSRGGAMMQQPTPDGMDTGTSGRLPRPQFRSATATPATRLRGNSAEDMEGVETEGGGDGGAPLLAAEGSEEDMGGTAKAHGRAGDVGGGSTPAPAPQPPVGGSGGWGLGGSVDVQTCRAEWALHRGAYEQCYALTSRLLERDACALQALPAHLVAALQLGKKSDLFLRGHKLVEAYPHLALSWFAVGCYYMCTGSYENARSYFGKATTLEPSFAPAWVAFGHAFAAQDERDQAMAAYRSAARLFPGLHTPLLGMGMEYLAMNNLQVRCAYIT